MANWQELTGQQGQIFLNLSNATCIKADASTGDMLVVFDAGQSYKVKQTREDMFQRAKMPG